MKRQRKAFTRDERKHMVVQAFLVEESKIGYHGEMSTAQIANYLHVTPSTRLRDILTEMVIEGTLVEMRERSATIKGYTRWFHLPSNYLTHNYPSEPKRHALRIKGLKNGVVVTQEVLL